MQRDKAIAIVQKAILEHEGLSPNRYKLEDSFDSIGSDSLDLVEICMIVEEEVHSDISPRQVDNLNIINDLVKLVEQV